MNHPDNLHEGRVAASPLTMKESEPMNQPRNRVPRSLKVLALMVGLTVAVPWALADITRQITVEQTPIAELSAPDSSLKLDIWLDRSDGRYLPGESAQLYLRPDRDVQVVVLNVDARGATTVLFPNQYARDNRLSGQRVHTLPAPDAPYHFRVSEPMGINLIKVIASTDERAILDTGQLRSGNGPFARIARSTTDLARQITVTINEQPDSQWAMAEQYLEVVQQRPGTAGTQAPAAQPSSFGLDLRLEQDQYRQGEHLALTIAAERDCTLTLVNISETRNEAVVLYPNEAVPQVRLQAGRQTWLPGADSPVRLSVLGPPGGQTLMAVCTEESVSLLGNLSQYAQRSVYPQLNHQQWVTLQAAAQQQPRSARASVQFRVVP